MLDQTRYHQDKHQLTSQHGIIKTSINWGITALLALYDLNLTVSVAVYAHDHCYTFGVIRM
jgi:hypothetical protein